MMKKMTKNPYKENIGFVALIAFLLIFLFGVFIYEYIPQSLIKKYETNIAKEQNSTCKCRSENGKIIVNEVADIDRANLSIYEKTGTVGDTFGGTLGPIVALFAALLTFLAFWVQYQANEQQKKHLNQQGFEDTFFRLLDTHQRIVDSMDIRDPSNVINVKAVGRECFKNMYQDFDYNVKNKSDINRINSQYDIVQKHYRNDLHHYFRFLYHMLKFIKNAEINDAEKFKYASILRATLSAYELAMIFYNGMHDNGKTHFKPLIEEYSFLKNLDDSLVLSMQQKLDNYHKLAFASSNERIYLLPKWEKERKHNEE